MKNGCGNGENLKEKKENKKTVAVKPAPKFKNRARGKNCENFAKFAIKMAIFSTRKSQKLLKIFAKIVKIFAAAGL